MIYTNKTLEFNKNKRNNTVLELNTLYGQFISIPADKNITGMRTLNRRFHTNYTLSCISNDKFRIDKKNDDDIYLILDTLEYKNFNSETSVEVEKDSNFEMLKNYKMQDRAGFRHWNILLLKWKKPKKDDKGKYIKDSILKYKDTSGTIRFIIINKDGKLEHINNYKCQNFRQTDEKNMVSLI